MNFQQWVSAVLMIAEQRGISVVTTYPRNGWVTFNWQCRNGSQFGSCGAGMEMIEFVTPEQYTWLWNCSPTPAAVIPLDSADRKGRYIPRIPAIAVSESLRILFNV